MDVLAKLPAASVGSLIDKLPHNPAVIDMADDVMTITKPSRILEIGTHKGGSGTIWLSRSDAHLTSFDIGGEWVRPDEHERVVKVWNEAFPGRFTFFRADSNAPETFERLESQTFDLAFVDGDHHYECAKKDIDLCLNLGIPYILIDDYTTCEDARRAAADSPITHVKTYHAVHNFANIGLALFRGSGVRPLKQQEVES